MRERDVVVAVPVGGEFAGRRQPCRGARGLSPRTATERTTTVAPTVSEMAVGQTSLGERPTAAIAAATSTARDSIE